MSGEGRKQTVLIVGGGVAGLEAALALHDLAGDRLDVTVCDPRREFVLRSFAVGEPYGAARVFRCDLRHLVERCGASLRTESIASVDPARRLVFVDDGERLPYDALLVAPGVRMLPSVPGAVTFRGVADEGEVGEVLTALREGALRRLVFTVPAGHSWALPLYELALLAATELVKGGNARTQLTIVTPEDAPLAVFGQRAAEQMGELLAERGIEVLAGAHPVEFDRARLQIAPGSELEADAVVSLPRLEGCRIAGIPHDPEGFVGIDEHGRAIGLEGVFAAGDVTAFPVKQAGIATQQADVAAGSIAADAGAAVDRMPFEPVLRGVLWAGRVAYYLYGRPTAGHGDASSLSEGLQDRLPNGLVDSHRLAALFEAIGEPAARRFG